MNRTLLNAAGALAAAVVLAGPAEAQGAQCAWHEDMVRHLAVNWGEARHSIALDASSHVVEIFVNWETGSWTLVVTSPGGPSCMIASGQAFEVLDETPDISSEG